MSALVRAPLSWRGTVLTGLLVGSAAFAYAGVGAALVRHWWADPMYSHGFLIPWISLYLVWVRRDTAARLRPVPNVPVGLLVLGAGLSMLVAGQAGGVISLQEVSLVVTVAGLVLMMLGADFLKVFWLPVAYLLFMIPVWDVVTNRLHFPFQLLSASLGVTLLQTVGIPAYRRANFIELPNALLEVAKACSGVNYLVAVVAIGIPLAYLFLESSRRRALLLGSALVIAVLSNALRVALIGLSANYGLGRDPYGPFHVFQGLSVAMVGYGALFLGLSLLATPGADRVHQPGDEAAARARARPEAARGLVLRAAGLSALLLATGAYVHFYEPAPVPPGADLRTLPLGIGEWRGQDTRPAYLRYRDLGVDRDLSRIYESPAGDRVHLYVAYFEVQRQGRELVHYHVEDLFDGSSRARVPVGEHGSLEVNRTVRRRAGGVAVSLFWYDLNGRALAAPWQVKAYTAWDAIAHGRTNGAVILLMADFAGAVDPGQAVSSMETFLQQLVPVLAPVLTPARGREARRPLFLSGRPGGAGRHGAEAG